MTIQTESTLAEEFYRNTDEIALELINLYSLKYTQKVANLSSPLMRWLDFRFRYVDPQPRQVVFSNKFPKKDLPANAQKALKKLTRLIREGKNINPYQGRGLILRNDISSETNDARTDLLWADWDILHFHLSEKPIPKEQFFSPSADYLAFSLVGENLIAFIDVLPHPGKEGFANPDLINTVTTNWPDFINQFRLNVILSGNQKSQSEIHALRSNGVLSPIKINGIAYMSPGLGVTSASTPLKLTIVYDRLRGYIRELSKLVSDPTGQFQLPNLGLHNSEPKFSLKPTRAGLAVYEENSGHAFILPTPQKGHPVSFLAELHDLILPNWAREFYLSRLKSDNS